MSGLRLKLHSCTEFSKLDIETSGHVTVVTMVDLFLYWDQITSLIHTSIITAVEVLYII